MTDGDGRPDLGGRIALVTGASRGLGAAIGCALAAAGAHVVLAARTVGGLEACDDAIRAAGGQRPTLIPLDLADGDQIDRLGPALYERFGGLDMLVSAAAVLHALSPVAHVAPARWADTFRVNVEANFRLIRILDPLLRRAAAGRAVFITDAAGRPGTAYWNAYAASKAALETLVLSWAGELARMSVRVNLYDPGPMRTKLRATAFPGEDPASVAAPADRAAAVPPLLAADCRRHGEIVRA
ncbi:MAG: SDR family NAD(P)-dependent oxidoreductase [Alphaproteobacteria bacterium]